MPAHPKLRSSCDGCGMAKVKCDRTQPECGRCASHSMKCIYGVSRKMGKPPREKMRLKTSSHKPGNDHLRGTDPPPPGGPAKMLDSVYGGVYHHGNLHHNSLHHNGNLHHHSLNGHDFADPHYLPGHHGLVAGLNCGSEPRMEDMLAGWEPLEHDHARHAASGGFLVNMEALDPLYGEYVDPALPLLATHDFGGEWSLQQDPSAAVGTARGGYLGSQLGSQLGTAPFGPLSTPESPEMSGDSSMGQGKPTVPAAAAWYNDASTATTTTTTKTATTATTRSDSVASWLSSAASHHSGGGGGGHDCAREAHDILESLSPARLGRLLGGGGDGAPAATGGPADAVPLDAILQLNREASGRLGRLLACGAGCARAPAPALLYASIVARVLAWYQQAAASCATAPPWTGGGGPPAHDAAADAAAVGPWDATIVVACGSALPPTDTTTPAAAATVPGGDPHIMALGAFSIDDLRVQRALKVQLLAGEMRRAARLIDKFAAFGAATMAADGLSSSSSSSSSSPSSPPAVSVVVADGVDALCLGLEAWLRGEHARIDGLLRAQLQELSY